MSRCIPQSLYRKQQKIFVSKHLIRKIICTIPIKCHKPAKWYYLHKSPYRELPIILLYYSSTVRIIPIPINLFFKRLSLSIIKRINESFDNLITIFIAILYFLNQPYFGIMFYI